MQVETDSLILGAGSGADGTGKFLSGVLFIGNEGKIYGNSYELNQDAAISQFIRRIDKVLTFQ